jgi:DNA polymerase III alpha subunit
MQMSQSVSSTRASKAPLTNVGGKSEVIKTRTGYSFRKAVGHIPEVVRALKAAGHDYAPIVDRASTFGYAKWVSEAAKQGLPHVFGVELAVSKLINAKKPSSDQWAFLALDDLSGINRLINTATQQFRYQPLLTVEQAISAPGVFKITGPAPPFELSDGPIEGVHIPLAPSTPMGVIKRAVRHGWPLIATHDSFYPTPEDRSFYEILCGRGADLQMHAQHILSEAEWRESVEPFGLSPAQLEDALALARRALERSAGIPLPKASLPHPERKATLREMCLHGAEERGLKVLGDEVYEARLNRELALIEEKDYTDYFYIVSDLCKWAKKNMVVGPARGSSCGSLVCYLLDITDIDPIPYGLIFERFIDVNRDDMPDIDIDFSDKNRHMVFDYLCERYGHDHVARLGTVAMYQPKSSLSEVGTALKIPKWMCDAVADSMLERSGGDARALFKIEDTLATMPAGQRLVQEYPEVAIVTKRSVQGVK